MMLLPKLGSAESGRYQVTLVDKSDKTLKPLDYPRINRFFDILDDRNTFVKLFEQSINESGGKLVHKTKLSHPLFESFSIFDKEGNQNFELTVYH